jgi:hypothetical protein
MNLIKQHLDKNNLHHAYLIEGEREGVVSEILEFVRGLGIETVGNSDFVHISVDAFKIEDARNLKFFGSEKGFSNEKNAKKIFVVSANSFLLEAQNSLLKVFEEPIENTHFFIVLPDTSALLKTFISRFYIISARQDLASEEGDAEKFIAMPLSVRINFLKDFLKEEEEIEDEIQIDSIRAKSLRFLNALEVVLHVKFEKNSSDTNYFEHLFKVREFLRMPGSSPKTLMESVALSVPVLKNMQSR